MKQDSRMVFVFLILALGAGLIPGRVRAGPDSGTAFSASLREEAAASFAQNQYAEFLAILEQRAAAVQTDEERFYVAYYQLTTQAAYLDYLEKEEIWNDFYRLRPQFDNTIISTVRELRKKYPDMVLLVDLQFLAWRAYVREEDAPGAAMAFAELGDLLFKSTESTQDHAKFREITDRVAQTGDAQQLNELLSRYREHVLRRAANATSPEQIRQIAEQYREEGDTDVAVAVYENYAQMVLDQYSQSQALFEIRQLINDFVHIGFMPARQAEFVEKLYEMAEARYGAQVWQEYDLFMRGVNLELAGRDTDAVLMYKRFGELFPESAFGAEAETRRGFILLFRLDDPVNGLLAWEGVSQKFGDRAVAHVCRYWAGVYYQWKGQDDQARNLFSAIPDNNWPYAGLAQQRLAEIEKHTERDEAVFHPFDVMFNPASAVPVELVLEARPSRVFMDQDVAFEGGAQDFSAGTVQPQFAYEWFGQLGQAGTPGNIPAFTTRYQSPGAQLVWLGVKTENTEGVVAQLVWNYGVVISVPETGSQVAARQLTTFTAATEPPLPDMPQLSWTWEFSGPMQQSVPGREVKIQFEEPGKYHGVVRVSAAERFWEKQFTFEVVP